ncbi:MAG: hypothetical protein JWQ43_3701 [Glaciihabitans sp.]|nr:hypothetical protein [Glaciihabitans sp.]
MLGLQALFVLVVFVPWLDREWLAHSGIPEVYTNLFVFGFFAIIPISLFVLLVGIATAKSDDRRGAVRGRIVIVGSIVVASAAVFIIVRDAQDQLGY